MQKGSPGDAILGGRIRAQRRSLGLSPEELADRLGVTFQQLQTYEEGIDRITTSRLQDISRILQVPITFWFGEDDQGMSSNLSRADAREFLSNANAIRLLKVFSQLEDTNTQNLVIRLCEELAKKQ